LPLFSFVHRFIPTAPWQAHAIVNLRSDTSKSVGMRLTVRSSDMSISQFIASSVA